MFRSVQIEADDVFELFHEARIVGYFEGAGQVRL